MLKGAGKRLKGAGKRLRDLAKDKLKTHKMRVLDRRRMARGSVKISHIYKRRILPEKQRPDLLLYLRENLFKPGFFENLLDIHRGRIKRLDFHFYADGKQHVVPVAIKDTNRSVLSPKVEGKNFEALSKSFEVHQKAMRKGKIKPKTYILRLPKVYGLIGNFLVMEFVDKTPLPKEIWKEIWPELERNISYLDRKTLSRRGLPKPEAIHAMPVANTSPGDLKGKWVVFLPHDIS